MKRVLMFVVVGLLAVFVSGCASTQTVKILTDEEGKLANAPNDTSYGFALVETVSDKGPQIRIKSPEPNKEHQSPVDIMIDFIPKEGTKVDVSTLQVEVLKIFTINITDRVIKYTDDKGIHAQKAEFPSGRHKIRISVSDNNGSVTEQIFVVKVL